jgi:hypothetical protein
MFILIVKYNSRPDGPPFRTYTTLDGLHFELQRRINILSSYSEIDDHHLARIQLFC